ncbi:hypothetical protein CXF83_00970 [Shewanella sp. Choline-02u-19]|jgi:hypothetical protein|nr:hypothetical protein CXF82_16745 [Shewanella sp. GutDb-MelDb]PKG75565.1 hypothetical protein CXF86_07020 [Shewanella sp. GutCb]PKH60002.1 hypothetical protein CXF84_03045 [Shewanella sp. Bg11-22]PKI30683.1 hypothetical protein CXF83_00970 [Shewanella sp. Choline-02u-19]
MQVEIYNNKSLCSETKHLSQALLILLSKGLPLDQLPQVKESILAGNEFEFKNSYIIRLYKKPLKP